MPQLLPSDHKEVSLLHARLMVAGAVRKKFELYADARITPSTNGIGVGPLAYFYPEKTPEGDDVFKIVCLFFNDKDKPVDKPIATFAMLENLNVGDMAQSLWSFANSFGGNINTMRGLAPTV